MRDCLQFVRFSLGWRLPSLHSVENCRAKDSGYTVYTGQWHGMVTGRAARSSCQECAAPIKDRAEIARGSVQ